MTEHRLAILISGGGTTMEAIAKTCQSGKLPIEVVCVIASKSSAGGLKKAKILGIPHVVVVNPHEYKKDGVVHADAFGDALLTVLRKADANLITQNGWLPLTPENVIAAYPDMIFNQHPGPLPETAGLYGLQPHAAMVYLATHRGNRGTEVVVQRVEKEFDGGPIVGRKTVVIEQEDSPEDLQKRALMAEHTLQIEVLKGIVSGSIRDEKQVSHYIRPGEEELLQDARMYAREKYPKG